MKTSAQIAGALSAFFASFVICAANVITDNFSSLNLAPNTHFDPSTIETMPTSTEKYYEAMEEWGMGDYFKGIYENSLNINSIKYGTVYNNSMMGESWHGFAYSSMTDTATVGEANQFSSITGSGWNGSSDYLVYYGDGAGLGLTDYVGLGTIGISSADSISALHITNTTYGALAMQNGYGVQSAFEDGDYFKLIFTGYDADGNEIGATSILLADGTDILSEWVEVDIEALMGSDVRLITFDFEQWYEEDGKLKTNHGCTAPLYFALGGIETLSANVPEPAYFAVALGFFTLIAGCVRRRRK